jgi:hypothetical protein
MSADERAEQAGPDEEEVRRRVEEQLRTVRVQDLLLESIAGILNLSARRIAKEDERDLEQGRIGIEAVRALAGLLEPEPAKAVRDALSELQVLYAREASGAGEAAGGAEPEPPPATGGEPEPPRPGEPPPQRRGEPPPRLWTPPGSA